MKWIVASGFLLSTFVAFGCAVQVVVPLQMAEEISRAEDAIAFVRDKVVVDGGKVCIRLVGEEDPIDKFAAGLKLDNKAMQSELAKAMRDRAVRSKEIDAMKRTGAVGESDSGMLAYTPAAQAKDRTPERDELIESENKDRKTILSVYAHCFTKGVPEDRAKACRDSIRSDFASALQRRAAAGEWIQDQSGKWTKK